MRRARVGALALGMLVSLSACANFPAPTRTTPCKRWRPVPCGARRSARPVGAAFAINPGIGAPMGAATGATLGTLAGLLSAQQAVYYVPITPPTAAAIPGFYDGWAPGSRPAAAHRDGPGRRVRETRAEQTRLACDDRDAGLRLVAAPVRAYNRDRCRFFRDPVSGVQPGRAAARPFAIRWYALSSSSRS